MSPEDVLKKQQKELQKRLEEIELAEFFEPIPGIILARTRYEGSGISEKDGRKRSLKKLKESTVKSRQSLDNNGELHPDTAPRTSNLTRKGFLLDSIRLVRKNKKSISIEPTGKNDNGTSNKDVAKYVERKGFRFLGLTAGEKSQLDKNLRKALNEVVKKVFS